MAYLAVFTQEKDGRFSVSVPTLPGCFSQGDSFEDAKRNVEEAIELYLEDEEFDEEIDQGIQMVASIDIHAKR